MDNQFQEVHYRPMPNYGLHWPTHGYATWPRVPPHGPMAENSKFMPVLPHFVCDNSKTLEQSAGASDLLPRPDLYGKIVAQTIAESCKQTVARQNQHVHSDLSHPTMQESNSMVAGLSSCDGRRPMDIPTTRTDHLHRQFSGGLGGTPGLGESSGQMAQTHNPGTHQHKRDACHLENSDPFRTQDNAQKHHDSDGQYVLCELRKQIGRNQVPHTPGNHSTNPNLVSGQGNHHQGKTHTRAIQCNLGQTESSGTNRNNRVVDSPKCDLTDSSNLGNAHDRLVRDQVQLQSTNILQSNTRPKCPGNRRNVAELEQHDCLCVSSSSPADTNPPQDKAGTMYSVSHRSCMAVKILVSNPAESSVRSTQENNSTKKAPKTAIQQHLSPKPQCATTSRLATIKQHLKTQGFSQKSADSITKRCRPTTNKLYEAKWRIFCSWCRKRKVNPLKVTKQQLADFFTYLHDDLHKGHSAILGYKAVINSTIKLCKSRDICNNYHLESQLRSYKLEKPPTDKSVPKWNLNLVLNSLTKKPYEPMLSASLKHLTWKTTFLLSFATAARVSELTALSRKKVAHDRQWSKVSLQTSDSFVAKNQDLTIEPEPRTYSVPALYDFAGPDLPDRLLCPVRSLRYYLHKTDYIRTPEKKALLISHYPNHKGDITANTVSNWLKNVIKLAYQSAQPDDLKIAKVRSHEVRALAASTAFKENRSYQSINKACYWRGHSTFTNYYLRDLAMEQNYELQMPNVVAAATKVIKKK